MPDEPVIAKGQVFLVPFTYSDLEGVKRRPACVVSGAAYNEASPDLILAMITGKRSRIENPGVGDVVLTEWESAGLFLPSTVRVGRIVTMEARLLSRPIGSLSEADTAGVDAALRLVLDLAEPARA